MIKTPITDLLGITYPVFQGAMAWISDATLAAAVSEAGGLGTIAASTAPAGIVAAEIERAKSLTDKPFAVNVLLISPHADEVARLVADQGVKVVFTGAGNPAKYMGMWRDAGITVIPVIASVAMGRLMQRCGAAAVVAEGGEAGGHIGETGTIALVPQVCDALDIPVVAAGGIADGRGIAAAFMLGAAGVQLGTRFLVCSECGVHRNYKDKILKAGDIDTITTGKRLGHPVRSLKTPFSREYFKKEYDGAVTDDELEQFAVGALRLAAVEGDTQRGCFPAGQIAGIVRSEQTAREMIEEMFTEAERILSGAAKWIK